MYSYPQNRFMKYIPTHGTHLLKITQELFWTLTLQSAVTHFTAHSRALQILTRGLEDPDFCMGWTPSKARSLRSTRMKYEPVATSELTKQMYKHKKAIIIMFLKRAYTFVAWFTVILNRQAFPHDSLICSQMIVDIRKFMKFIILPVHYNLAQYPF